MNGPGSRARRLALVLALVHALGACAGGDGGGVDASGQGLTPLGYQPCGVDERVGGFRIDLAATFTGVQGAVADGIVPVNVPVVEQAVGECVLYRPRRLFCDPPCGAVATCAEDGACIPYPVNHSVGSVTVTGLAVPLAMEPLAPAHVYTNPEPLPHPGFATGAALALAAAGGDFEPFALRGVGVEAIEPVVTEVAMTPDQPVFVAWAPPADANASTRVVLDLNIALHGGTPGRIECTVADSGELAIPADLATSLLASGASGFPTLILTRQTADSAHIGPGCVDLRVLAEVSLPVSVPGLVSCTEDEDCPSGQTCQADLTCG
jgi:hypothetical protein